MLDRVPSTITILIDTREKTPLLFPSWIDFQIDRTGETHHIKVETENVCMPAGDYTILGHDDVCIFETKRSLSELHKNVCTKDWTREQMALRRLSEACFYKYLLWEMTPSELARQTTYIPSPSTVIDRWMQAIQRFDLRLMLSGTSVNGPGPRRKLGDLVIRTMLVHLLCPEGQPVLWDREARAEIWREAPKWVTRARRRRENR